MSITIEYVNRLFENLSTGNATTFFENVADDVHWTVMGTHPLAGVYKSTFLAQNTLKFNRRYRLRT